MRTYREGIPAPSAAEDPALRLLLCDDAPEARDAVRAMIADHPEIVVVGEAADGEEALALAFATSPDVVLMDIGMPVLDGIAATRRIRELLPTVRVVAFAGSDDPEVIEAMVEAGASGYCVKGCPLWELERAIAGASTPLVGLAHTLARSIRGGGTATLVARELAGLAGADVAAVYLAAPDVSLSLAAKAGPGSSLPLEEPPALVHRSFEQAGAVWASSRELAGLVERGLPCSEALAVPLLNDGTCFGVVFVAMPADLELRADSEFVSAVADLAAAALAHERRLVLTHAEARRDALTGLPNRRAFDERLAKLVRAGRRVALVLFDIDDFKRINDEEGHQAGDEVLRELARVLARALRATEEAYRIGGEEFAVLLEGGEDEGVRVASRMRREVLRHRRRRQLPTLSAGVACFPGDARTTDELVAGADVALYAAKAGGKNQVVSFGSERFGSAVSRLRGADGPEASAPHEDEPGRGLRILLVDDDEALRFLLRTTLEVVDVELDEAGSAAEARAAIAAHPPDVIVLDARLPGEDGLELCRELRESPATRDVPIVLLTGDEAVGESAARAAGADALLHKPFSPVELLAAIEGRAAGLLEDHLLEPSQRKPEAQLLRYAQDLRRLLELERGQRRLLQQAYRQTVAALVGALESKDSGTREHCERVQRYALELARAVDESLSDDPSVEFGFLLHDVGKLGVPDRILQKAGPLEASERRAIEEHTLAGARILDDVDLVRGGGLSVVRSHHERWDGQGYPDALAGPEIPLAARVFAVADTLDAITSDRPYRRASEWDTAVAEIVRESGHQFDPAVVEAFREQEPRLRRIHETLRASREASAVGDPWAGEDERRLEADDPPREEELDLAGFGRALVLGAAAGALLWGLVGLALYALLT